MIFNNPFRFVLGSLVFALALSSPVQANLPMSMNGKALPSLANMLEKSTPAVVNIATEGHRQVNQRVFSDPVFEHFFGNVPTQKKSKGTGSGVIINANKGYIVTNYHVIAKAQTIMVTLNDGRKSVAKVLGADSKADLAVIQINEKGLIALPLGNSDKLRVGDFAVAIGNPYGLGQSVTSGIVSALGRSDLGIEDYEDFIQTDASINPGNSGGALVNLNGALIGINTAILGGDGGGNVGIGFAIPVNMMSNIVNQLIRYGRIERGQLGVVVHSMDPKLAKALGAKDHRGAVVAEVIYGSPADLSGVKAGDIITHINNIKVKGANDVRNKVGAIRVGTRVNIQILRQGNSSTITAVIGKEQISQRRVTPAQNRPYRNSSNHSVPTPSWDQH